MPNDPGEPTSPDFGGEWKTCGCGGKTPLERIVFPALNILSKRISNKTVIGEGSDCGLVPVDGNLERKYTVLNRQAESVYGSDPDDIKDGRYWSVGGSFIDPSIASSPSDLSSFLRSTYDLTGSNIKNTVLKGHTVQLPDATTSFQFLDLFSTVGSGGDGYWMVNFDAIHAFPDLGPALQSRIATLNALNDCYAVGANKKRRVRPFVLAPNEECPTAQTVCSWFPSGGQQLRIEHPAIVQHNGDSWIFGASVVATTYSSPPTRISSIKPGDAVLLHRPLGALSLIATSAEDNTPVDPEGNAVRHMTEDHRPVANSISKFLPFPDEEFDPKEHIKLATDISGPGISELNRIVSAFDLHLHVNSLPLIDESTLSERQRRWLVPDVTSETNGPIAVIGAPEVTKQFKSSLAEIDSADPAELGVIENGASDMTAEVPLQRYIETYTGN